jgi:hypothetical protein
MRDTFSPCYSRHTTVFKKQLRADDVLFDKTHVTRQHQDLHAKSPELLSSPSQLINRGRWLGKKQMTTSGLNVLNVEEYANDCLYIIISGGVHVVMCFDFFRLLVGILMRPSYNCP